MKKTEKKELMRIQTVLEKDRLSVGKGFEELLVSDLGKLLKDYFDFSSEVEYEVVKEKGEYRLNISLVVSRIKSLNTITK